MSQHAYLIMAHQHPEQLRMLMRCLDYKNNDIFLHIDAKYKDFDGIKHQLSAQVRNAKLVVLRNRVDVRWGIFRKSNVSCVFLKQQHLNRPTLIIIYYLAPIYLLLLNRPYITILMSIRVLNSFISINISWIVQPMNAYQNMHSFPDVIKIFYKKHYIVLY